MQTEKEYLLLKQALLEEKKKNEILEKQNTELVKIKESFDAFLDNTPDYVYIKNCEHQFIFASEPFAKLTGHANRHEIIGKTDFDIFPLNDAKTYYKEQKKVIENGKVLLGIEEPYHDNNDNLYWISTSKIPLYNEEGQITGLIGMSRDITNLKELQLQLKQHAYFDNLTGLYNRHYFFKEIERITKIIKKTQEFIGIIFIDLDGFKPINDEFGHDAGNIVLQEISKKLKSSIRESDIICRFGGDEFIIASIMKKSNDLETLAQKILSVVNETIPYLNHKLQVSCSIGISFDKNKSCHIDELIKKADDAMYKAKNSGKNCFFIDK